MSMRGKVMGLAFGGIAFAQIPTAAQAQCNSSSNPSPPPAVTANFSNQSFGVNPPLKPYVVTSPGIAGCVGKDGGYSESGVEGSPGQAGGQINGTNTALTIIGGADSVGSISTIGASIASVGGTGGDGGRNGFTASDQHGGNGGAGGAGGNIVVGFDGTFVPDPQTGLATYGLYALSAGAAGGNGGASNDGGTFYQVGGDGGQGGPADRSRSRQAVLSRRMLPAFLWSPAAARAGAEVMLPLETRSSIQSAALAAMAVRGARCR
jgi:hypothetical protein